MKLFKTKFNSKGFTLIELLVVSTIIVVLSAIGMVSFANAGKSARNAKRKADLETVRQALVLYKSDVGTYPNGVTGSDYASMIVTLSSGYISQPTPLDPKNTQSACGVAGTTTCGYTYVGASTSFTLTAPLEGEVDFELTNP